VEEAVSLYGTGGHAGVVLDTLRARDVLVDSVFDDAGDAAFFGGRLIQPGVFSSGDSHVDSDGTAVIICIGANAVRADVAAKLHTDFATSVHPSASVDDNGALGSGTVVFHGAVIERDVRIGHHVIVNTAAWVGERCELEDFVHISPKAHVGEGARIEEGAHIGAAARIAPGVRVGAWSTVGAGSVVTSDVAAHRTVVGSPARVLSDRSGQDLPKYHRIRPRAA
jgi:sugar O-acyltransferase (sialic acid O-acetyltransferase NeuD family)